MDGASAAASVVALLEVSLKVVSLCKEYYSKVKDAKDDINRFRLEFQTFVHILRGLRKLAKDFKTAHIFASQSLVGSITQCQSDLKILEQKLNPGKHQKTMSRFGMWALRWPFQSSDVEKIMQSLERYKSTFNATLNILSIKRTQRAVVSLIRLTEWQQNSVTGRRHKIRSSRAGPLSLQTPVRQRR